MVYIFVLSWLYTLFESISHYFWSKRNMKENHKVNKCLDTSTVFDFDFNSEVKCYACHYQCAPWKDAFVFKTLYCSDDQIMVYGLCR